MKGLRIVGSYIFEYFLITLLLILSLILVIPFIPVYIGVYNFFKRPMDDRMFIDIFKTIKREFKIIIPYSLVELGLIIFGGLNVYYMTNNPENMNLLFLIASYIALIIALILFIHAPAIISNMNVSFRQLLVNSFMLTFGGVLNSLLMAAIVVIYLFGVLNFATLIPIGLYFLCLINNQTIERNILTLKARSMNMSVEELKRKQNEDDYIDEYGNIRDVEE